MENLRYLKKYGFYFLLIAVIADFLTPYVLGRFYPKLNQLTAVISLFGDIDSPVRSAFLIWSVVAGSFYTLSLPAIYAALKETSKGLASLATAAIGLYGIGDCIFTGLFSVDSVGFLDLGAQYRLRDRLYWLFAVSFNLILDLQKTEQSLRKPALFKIICFKCNNCCDVWTGSYPAIESIHHFSAARILAETQFCF